MFLKLIKTFKVSLVYILTIIYILLGTHLSLAAVIKLLTPQKNGHSLVLLELLIERRNKEAFKFTKKFVQAVMD